LHFENILWCSANRKFTFLDWRQDFGGELVVGDVYYDLAKLLHGLIMSHEMVSKGAYDVSNRFGALNYDFHRKQILVECERYFDLWLVFHNYDRKKVRVLAALIFLNIAVLHGHNYGLLLYALGTDMLSRELESPMR